MIMKRSIFTGMLLVLGIMFVSGISPYIKVAELPGQMDAAVDKVIAAQEARRKSGGRPDSRPCKGRRSRRTVLVEPVGSPTEVALATRTAEVTRKRSLREGTGTEALAGSARLPAKRGRKAP